MQIIAALLVAVALFAADAAPVCRVGSWSGSPADLAVIEAVHQLDQAAKAGRTFPQGDAPRSPWSGLVTCSEAQPPRS